MNKTVFFQEDQINRQLDDKERVAAALENDNLIRVVNQALRKSVEEEKQKICQKLIPARACLLKTA